MHGEGDEAGLGAVVQVAFDTAEGLRGVVDGPGAGLLQGADPAGRGVGAEQHRQQGAVRAEGVPQDQGATASNSRPTVNGINQRGQESSW